MFNDIDIYKTGYEDARTSTSHKVRQYASRFVKGHLALFIGPGCEEKWFRGYNCKPKVRLGFRYFQMVKHFEETGHYVFKGTGSLNRGIMCKRKSKDTIHYNRDPSNVELLNRIFR